MRPYCFLSTLGDGNSRTAIICCLFLFFVFTCPSTHPQKDPQWKWLRDGMCLVLVTEKDCQRSAEHWHKKTRDFAGWEARVACPISARGISWWSTYCRNEYIPLYIGCQILGPLGPKTQKTLGFVTQNRPQKGAVLENRFYLFYMRPLKSSRTLLRRLAADS